MQKGVLGILDRFIEIECCANGFTKLAWKFTQNSREKNIDFKDVQLSMENTTLTIQHVKAEHEGNYTCNATDDVGGWISGTTEMGLGCADVDSSLAITVPAQKNSFYEHARGSICCSMTTLGDNYINKLWYFDPVNTKTSWDAPLQGSAGKQNLTTNRGYIWWHTSIESGKCSSETFTNIMTCVEFENLLMSDTGNYTCKFQRLDEFNKHIIKVSVSLKPDYTMVYAGSISVSFTLVLVAVIFICVFYYDIILLCRMTYSCPFSDKKVDLLIVYDDRVETNISVALRISESLSEFGVRSFVYDRDKIYGATVHDNLLRVISESSRILFFLTPTSIDNEQVFFCFKNSKQKRIYIFYPTRTEVLAQFYSMERERTFYNTVKLSGDHKNWMRSYMKKSFLQRRFFKWIMTKLPNRIYNPPNREYK